MPGDWQVIPRQVYGRGIVGEVVVEQATGTEGEKRD